MRGHDRNSMPLDNSSADYFNDKQANPFQSGTGTDISSTSNTPYAKTNPFASDDQLAPSNNGSGMLNTNAARYMTTPSQHSPDQLAFSSPSSRDAFNTYDSHNSNSNSFGGANPYGSNSRNVL
ncbi:unnamed protein product [Ambrosiozyma monospora]|uniref:Unnamed protein product n=1 Tax=Ambrosiozyma monospora TaxID=43982 RepID=A0ACB5TEZ8_AMBMO|nr:unnamed protein product [Ambrosiozyma monospora]